MKIENITLTMEQLQGKMADKDEKYKCDFDELKGEVRKWKEEVKKEAKTQITNLKADFKKEVTEMKKEITALKVELNKFKSVGSEVNGFREQVKRDMKIQTDLLRKQAEDIGKNRRELSNCLTDLKVSAVEYSRLWKGEGFRDDGKNGYVITGARNHNRDDFLDDVFRRKILMKRNNNWHPLHE